MRRTSQSLRFVELAKPQTTVYPTAPPPPPAEEVGPPQGQLVTEIAVLLLAGYATKKLIELLTPKLRRYGVTPQAVELAVSLARRGTVARPRPRNVDGAPSGFGGVTNAAPIAEKTREVADQETAFRAAYLANAARRIQGDLNRGKSPLEAVRRENRNRMAHEKARLDRLVAMAKVARAASMYGPLLGWYLNPLLNNEPECVTANGNNFYATEGTVIGFPGSVHARCGCKPGPPHADGKMVNDVMGNVVKISERKFRMKKAETA